MDQQLINGAAILLKHKTVTIYTATCKHCGYKLNIVCEDKYPRKENDVAYVLRTLVDYGWVLQPKYRGYDFGYSWVCDECCGGDDV